MTTVEKVSTPGASGFERIADISLVPKFQGENFYAQQEDRRELQGTRAPQGLLGGTGSPGLGCS